LESAFRQKGTRAGGVSSIISCRIKAEILMALRRNLPAGAKALDLWALYGTTKVVQFHDILYTLSPHILYSFLL
jgi:hypothetical protein